MRSPAYRSKMTDQPGKRGPSCADPQSVTLRSELAMANIPPSFEKVMRPYVPGSAILDFGGHGIDEGDKFPGPDAFS